MSSAGLLRALEISILVCCLLILKINIMTFICRQNIHTVKRKINKTKSRSKHLLTFSASYYYTRDFRPLPPPSTSALLTRSAGNRLLHHTPHTAHHTARHTARHGPCHITMTSVKVLSLAGAVKLRGSPVHLGS